MATYGAVLMEISFQHKVSGLQSLQSLVSRVFILPTQQGA